MLRRSHLAAGAATPGAAPDSPAPVPVGSIRGSLDRHTLPHPDRRRPARVGGKVTQRSSVHPTPPPVAGASDPPPATTSTPPAEAPADTAASSWPSSTPLPRFPRKHRAESDPCCVGSRVFLSQAASWFQPHRTLIYWRFEESQTAPPFYRVVVALAPWWDVTRARPGRLEVQMPALIDVRARLPAPLTSHATSRAAPRWAMLRPSSLVLLLSRDPGGVGCVQLTPSVLTDPVGDDGGGVGDQHLVTPKRGAAAHQKV